MKLKYKILWIEDEKDWVESEIEFIEDYLKEYGFVLEYENPEKYKEYDFSEFDMIVVDYKLAGEEHGQDVIEKIRVKELYTEILFYSQIGEEKLRKIIAKKERIDGVYCASKNNCTEKLKRLIYTTIRKTQKLNNLRGLVMAETSELDGMVKEILKLVVEKNKVEENKIVERGPKLKRTHTDRIKTIEGYVLPRQFVQFVKSRCFEANFSLRTLESFATCSRNSLIKGKIEPYKKIQEERNNLAHIPEDSSTPTLMKIKGVEYNEQKFIDIRKNIQEFKKLFQEIIDDLNN